MTDVTDAHWVCLPMGAYGVKLEELRKCAFKISEGFSPPKVAGHRKPLGEERGGLRGKGPSMVECTQASP